MMDTEPTSLQKVQTTPGRHDPTAVASLIERLERAEAENERLREALTPSGGTKAAYMGEFSFSVQMMDEEGEEQTYKQYVPWDQIKEIMAAIRARAALEAK